MTRSQRRAATWNAAGQKAGGQEIGMTPSHRRAATLGIIALCAACTSPFDADEATCSDGPFFSQLPAEESMIESVAALGEIRPPGNVLPRARTDVRLATEGLVTVFAVGDLEVTAVESTRWLVSPTRTGRVEYGVAFELPHCAEIEGEYRQLIDIQPQLLSQLQLATCEIRSMGQETVESCTSRRLRMPLPARSMLGLASGERGFGIALFDERVANPFVSPHRFWADAREAVCLQSLFVPELRDILLDRVARGGMQRTAEPVCGTMSVDVEGTAQGMWVVDGQDVPLNSATAHLFFALAPDAVLPETFAVLATSNAAFTVEEIGSPLYGFALEAAGRVNRPFTDLPPDGTIHCYVPSVESPLHDPVPEVSFFIALDDDEKVTLERRDHAPDASPCHSEDADAWGFTDDALRLMR